MQRINVYASGGLDRVAHWRTQADWLERLGGDGATRVVAVWRSRNLIVSGESPEAVFLPAAEARSLLTEARSVALLGLLDDVPHLAVDLSHLDEADARRRAGSVGDWTDLRLVGGLMERRQAALLAYARGLMHWHTRHGFCGVCGSPTEIVEAGHVRKCTDANCGTSHFPRTDPAVIMLVHDGDKGLLGRQKIWDPGRYSTLAGFVETGESLEDAVAREVFEETGIRIKNVRYHSSQPWPFPASLMIGFHADAASTEIDLTDSELEDAQWFTRQQMRDFHAVGKSLPRVDSISRRLIEDWLAQG
jgi:NAD+ diphosphatase